MISKFLFKRTLSLSAPFRFFSVGIGHPPTDSENPIRFKFNYARDGIVREVLAREGETLLEVAHNNEIELEGACA